MDGRHRRGGQARADDLLALLRALGPALDTFAVIPVTDLGLLHMDPDGPVPCHGDGMLLRDLSPAGVVSFVSSAHEALLSLELRHLGGALAPGRATGGGAVDSLDAAFALFAAGFTPDAASGAAVCSAVTAVQYRMLPWSTGGSYLNFTERRRPGADLFGAGTYQRLRQVKAAFDPGDVVRANHPVEA